MFLFHSVTEWTCIFNWKSLSKLEMDPLYSYNIISHLFIHILSNLYSVSDLLINMLYFSIKGLSIKCSKYTFCSDSISSRFVFLKGYVKISRPQMSNQQMMQRITYQYPWPISYSWSNHCLNLDYCTHALIAIQTHSILYHSSWAHLFEDSHIRMLCPGHTILFLFPFHPVSPRLSWIFLMGWNIANMQIFMTFRDEQRIGQVWVISTPFFQL